MSRVPLLLGALAAFLVLGEFTFGPLDASSQAAATVRMKDATFAPADVSIAEGQTVDFINDDEAPHTVTAAGKAFDSGNIDPGHDWKYTFDKAGTYVYGCTYHSWMHATVKVLPMAQNVQPSARPALYGVVLIP